MPHHRDVRPGPRNYKDEPAPVAGDPVHHPHHPQQGPPPSHLQHPRPSSIVQQHQQQHHPASPQQPPPQGQHPGAYASPHATAHGLPLQHQSPYPQQGPGPNGQAHSEVTYYGSHPGPYGTPVSGQYSASETPELMAAAHMQRPYPPIYHTPQSNSPASVASPQSHDQHGRPLYGQPPPQMAQGMYGYPQYPPMSQVHPSPYGQHPGQAQQHPGMPSQPLLMSHQQQGQQQQMQHQQPQGPPAGMTNSPRPKIEPSVMQQRPLDPSTLQRPPSGPINPNNGPTGPPTNGNGLHQAGAGAGGVNPNAAPGPIPATTPLVVRQDNNGVQWIAFEYSRDRVKMEYTIRCDVESVNTESLSAEFKQENCVYPRACCNKDQYRGNRLIYETECNTVGWALADLNPCLRGKRGLIQRAVDSWRNSNQDPKLRSRRVRRMAKLNTRKQVSHTPNHMVGPGGPPGIPGANSMAAPAQRPPPSNMGMGGPTLHHHHAHPDGTAAGGPDDVSGAESNDLRPSQIFHGYPSYPGQNMNGVSMAPALHDGMNALGAHGPSAHNSIAASVPKTENDEKTTALYGDLPESKRRKFILVDDTARNTRVRVRVTLDQVEMKEMPDSYRKTNSVFPRSYFPMQMQSPPSSARGSRFFEDEDPEGGSAEDGRATLGKTLVPVPMMDGGEGELAVPKLTRAKKRKEVILNDLGYRMSWSQSRVFAGRIMFLQKSLDAYRNKMRSTMLAATGGAPAQEVSTVAPHFETRVGKRRLGERAKRSKRAATP